MNLRDHLNTIVTQLTRHGFSTIRWKDLGLKLKLDPTELENIKANNDKVEECLQECIKLWLKTNYATHSGLVGALQEMGEKAAADELIIPV